MKVSLAGSTVLHAAVLGFALVSIGAPEQLQVDDVEALPVDIIPFEAITQVQRGEREAPASETASPEATVRDDIVEDAAEIGENDVDLKPSDAPIPTPREVESAAAPQQNEDLKPAPDPVEKTIEAAAEEIKAAPATEVAALPEPSQPVIADPTPEAAASEPETKAETFELPDVVPVPTSRPERPPAQTAKTPERKNETPQQKTETASTKQSDFNADEIAALLNKQDAAGGGAQRSQEVASLGGQQTTSGSKLSQSEMDALRGQIQKCWNIIPGMADGGDVRVRVTMRLDKSGAIEGRPQVSATGGSDSSRQVLSGSARRAVLRCSPYNLPAEKYDAWADVIINFDPSQMF